MKTKLTFCITVVLAGLLLHGFLSSAEETATRSPVPKQAPLTLTIETPTSAVKSSAGISFAITFHNPGAHDLLLNAGQMLGNGSQLWDSLEAELTNETDQRMPLKLHWGVAGVAGRIYFLGIPLRAGSSYKLWISPNDYYVGTGERLKPGRYEIRFVYRGRQSAHRDPTQMPACWEGEARSNVLKVEVPPEDQSVRVSEAGHSSDSAKAPAEDFTARISAILAECQKIKPGMKRADLLKVFTTEGGLSTAVHRTFVHRNCPFIKVDVDFTLSDPTQKIVEERPTDTIAKISGPYLAWSIVD